MTYWTYKVKRWIVHKLGGYMANECIVEPNKVKHLACTRRFSKDSMYGRREDYLTGWMKAEAVSRFLDALRHYVTIEVTENDYTREYIVRTTIRVVDDRR